MFLHFSFLILATVANSLRRTDLPPPRLPSQLPHARRGGGSPTRLSLPQAATGIQAEPPTIPPESENLAAAPQPRPNPPSMAAATGTYDKLDKSFKIAARFILTAVSRKDVNDAFPSFTDAQRELLHRLFIYVLKSLHRNIVEEFRNFCDEIKIATALDKIDQFVEEQTLDVLSSDKTSIEDIKESTSKKKKDEIELLKGLLEKTQESNNAMKARIEHMKQEEDLNDTRKSSKRRISMIQEIFSRS
ncbi:hypothetical protein ZWY2020_017291 [Hordeum vulgare]|nr:hypothetical protein ZWY2020_017291 [Hordeum vulgare]